MSYRYIIEQASNGARLFFCEKFGRDVGNPAGGWVRDALDATRFDSKEAAEAKVERLSFRSEVMLTVRRLNGL